MLLKWSSRQVCCECTPVIQLLERRWELERHRTGVSRVSESAAFCCCSLLQTDFSKQLGVTLRAIRKLR